MGLSCFCISCKQDKRLVSKVRLSFVLDSFFKDTCVVDSISLLSKGQECLLSI